MGNVVLADEYTTINKVDYVVYDEAGKKAYAETSWYVSGRNIVYETIVGDLVIEPSVTINGTTYTVDKISKQGFSGQTQITSVLLNNVVIVEDEAFKECTSIQTADLSKVTSIGKLAFYECSSLATITLGNATRGGNAFYGTKISTLNIAAGVTTVPANVASGFTGTLTTVNLASGTTAIGADAFNGCSKLKAFSFNGITSIGARAFYGCSSLTGQLWLTLSTLGEEAFAGTGYTSLSLSGISSLAKGVFNGSGLKQAMIQDLQVIGESAFEDCPLTTFDFATVVSIGASAFKGTSFYGSDIKFSENLTSVGANAFSGTDAGKAYFKSNPSIGERAFRNSDMLILEISDATELNLDNTNTYGKVTYTRNSIDANKYAGVILPFVPKENANQVFYQLGDESNANVVEFNRVATADLEANTPYLFKNMGAKGAVTFESNGAVEIGGNTPEEITGGSWKANGVYSTQSNMASNGLLYSISGGDFTRYDQNLTVKPYRVYWTAPAKLSAIKFRAGDEDVTAIDFAEIDGFESVPATYYDLTGRRVLEPVKGNLYIVNGKKMVY